MIAFMVCPDEVKARHYGMERGWEVLAAFRMVTPERHDIRVVKRYRDLHVMTPKTPMLKGPEYDGVDSWDAERKQAWQTERRQFDEFVSSGLGEWVDL